MTHRGGPNKCYTPGQSKPGNNVNEEVLLIP